MFVRAEVYHACGGLDEYFFAHMEEIDLCWRMQLAGYKIMVCPAAVVYHVGGGTLPKGNARKVYLNFRNNLDPTKNFEADVSRNFDYGANVPFPTAEAQLNETIIKNMVDEIFNRIFSNW